jgi:hypothetical protein
MSMIKPETVGDASIPLKQNIPNNQSSVVMGLPFKPNTMTQGSFFSMSRKLYNKNVNQNVDGVGKPLENDVNAKKKWYGASSSRTSAEHIRLKGVEATGKGSTNQINTETFSFAGPDQTTVKTALARSRGSGSVAPKKKGAY